MLEIRVKKDESIEKALRRFKRQYKEELIKEVKKRRYYVKPGERRRRRKAQKRNRKAQ